MTDWGKPDYNGIRAGGQVVGGSPSAAKVGEKRIETSAWNIPGFGPRLARGRGWVSRGFRHAQGEACPSPPDGSIYDKNAEYEKESPL